MGNYVTPEEFTHIGTLMDMLNERDFTNISFVALAYDANGEPLGRLEFREGEYVYILGDPDE